MPSKYTALAILAMIVITLACAPATPTPSPDPPAPPTDTTMPAPPTDTTMPAPPTDTPMPAPPTDTPVSLDVTPPSPLPASHTGIILNDDECYDLDTGDAPYVRDDDCDILLVYPQILRPQNGAQLSGYAEMTPPSSGTCNAKAFDPGDLAPNTDLYICFFTNEGNYGFIVQRPDGAPFDVASHRLVFDWWLYP
jgi:hypothetical protein